ncbi:MAG: TonB-dependent receptor [Bacteroidales bacterium]|nr:TonB-dependent receptor [Bacteroidales bacterium]
MQKRRFLLVVMLCALGLTGFAQRTVTGTVRNASGESMIGVSVVIDGTSRGTTTDANGRYSIREVPDNAVLKFTYIGYIQQNVAVGNQNVINVVMQEDSKQLDELILVGYGVVRKSDLTGAVGSIHAEKIVAKGVTNLAGGLQGTIAGVNISQTSSRAGDGFSMQIRGKSSLQGGDPLYVVDGIVCDNIDFLNPMDIDKVDVLKDASSTAIYGSRATNGVLMITTKKGTAMGSAAKAIVSYDGYYGVRNTANMPDFMDGNEWMKWRTFRYFANTTFDADGDSHWELTDANWKLVWCNFSPKWKDQFINNDYTDWVGEVTRRGLEQNHFVNITGSSKDFSYRVGLGYQQEKGVLYDDYERWNMKAAVDHLIDGHWSTGAFVNLATSLKESGSANAIMNGFRMSPVFPARYWEGDNIGLPIEQPGKDAAIYPDGGGPTSTVNPILDRENTKDNSRRYDVMSNIYLQFSPVREVILKSTLAPMYSSRSRGQFQGSKSQARYNKTNRVVTDDHEYFSYTWDSQANYIKSFAGHTLNALGLVSVYHQRFESKELAATDMPFDVDWYNLGSASTVERIGSNYEKISMLSYVLRLNYDYMNRYYLTMSSRWDGSSKFQAGRRWGMFPSAAAAWRLSEESFMEGSDDWLSNLKLRLSFGITGNNGAVGAYQTQLLANSKYYYNFGGSVANGYGYELANSDLTWEKTREYDAGLDFGCFRNRITGSIDVYSRTSSDLLMEMETPLEMGSNTGAIWGNVGKVRNQGVEIQLNTVNIQHRDWQWTTSFTFAHNKNEILELNGRKDMDMTGNGWFIGQPIDVVYGYVPDGICTAEQARAYAADASKITKFHEGEYLVKDMNHDGVIDPNDRRVQGHVEPTWTGSINSYLTWKNIDFSFNIYTSQGSTVFSPFMQEFTDYSQRGMQRLSMDLYVPAGVPALGDDGELHTTTETHYGSYPFPTNSGNNKGCGPFWVTGSNGSQWFVDNSFTKVKNIVLGYSCPGKWIEKTGISHARLYINIVNPFTFTSYRGFDPEWAASRINNGQGGPASRSCQIGANLKF